MSQIMVPIMIIVMIVVAIITWFAARNYERKQYDSKVGSAEEKSREIIDEALKTAETKKREALLEAKEESLKTKNELEKETKERRAELQRYEKRVLSKEENVEKKADALEKKEADLVRRENILSKRTAEVEAQYEQGIQELERISGLTSEQAKEYLLKSVEEDVKHDTAKLIKELENKAREEADKKARDLVVTAIQRCAADHVAETTVSVVQLPNDEMKGRIIGREGRNIRTLETLTGVELIIDDTPEAVVLSGFDPIRREVARIALERLIVDGRIHPARIEEMVEKAQKEVENNMREEGEAACLEVGIHGIHPELVKLLGKMKFRTSYGPVSYTHLDCQVFAYLYEDLGMNEEVLEYLVEYCVQNGHTSMRYIEAVARSWHEKGIRTAQEAKDYSASYNRDSFAVMKAFGINSRKPAAPEQKLMDKWFKDYGFSRDVVLEACNRTITAIHNPSFQYADKILTDWKEAGVRGLGDIMELDTRRMAAKEDTARSRDKRLQTYDTAVSGQGNRTRKGAPNQFHNFEQRDTDYDALMLKQVKEWVGQQP